MSISNLKDVKDLLIKEAGIVSIGGVKVYPNDGVDLDITSNIGYINLDLVGDVEGTLEGEEVTFSMTVPEVSYQIIQEVYSYGDTDTAGEVGIGTLNPTYVTDYSKEIIIEPWSERAGSTAGWKLTLWQVNPDGDLSLNLLDNSDPWGCEVTFRALPDLTKADGNLIGKFELNNRGTY